MARILLGGGGQKNFFYGRKEPKQNLKKLLKTLKMKKYPAPFKKKE